MPAPKKDGEDQAIGRSRGGLSTKIHALVDALGNPLDFFLTGGEAHDLEGADHLLPSMEAGHTPDRLARQAASGTSVSVCDRHVPKTSTSNPNFPAQCRTFPELWCSFRTNADA